MNDLATLIVIYILIGSFTTFGIFRMIIESGRRGIADERYTEPYENLGLLIYKNKIRIGRPIYFLFAILLSICITPVALLLLILCA